MKLYKWILLLLVASLLLAGCSEQERWEAEQKEKEKKEKQEKLLEKMDELSKEIEESKAEREAKSPFFSLYGEAETPTAISSNNGKDYNGFALIANVKKSDFQSTSYSDIKTLWDYISNNHCRYFSIRFEDGTGILFADCVVLYPLYGPMSGDGSISETSDPIEDTGKCLVLLDKNDNPVTDETTPFGVNGIM